MNSRSANNRFSFLIIVVMLLAGCTSFAPISTTMPTSTDAPTITLTNTSIPSHTPSPTGTKNPDVNLDDFYFPFDLDQVQSVWDLLSIPSQSRFIEYHLVNRSDRSIPYEDPCGYHPGDLIGIIGTNIYSESFIIDTKMPYSGKLVDKWITQGNDDGFTFSLGEYLNNKVFLNSYHTQVSNLSIGQKINQGETYGQFTYTRDHCNCGYYESKVHLTLFNPAPNGGRDFLSDEVNILDITSYALPSTLEVAYSHGIRVLVVYEGPNYCDLTSQEKITRILNEYLPNAGYCVDENQINYCGEFDSHQGETFNYIVWDSRSIMISPQK